LIRINWNDNWDLNLSCTHDDREKGCESKFIVFQNTFEGVIDMKKWGTFFSFFVLIAFFAAGLAEGAGTLTLTFKYRDSSGVDQPLSSSYVYLRNAANEPPMEKFFSPADQISAPSSTTGVVTMSVPEGNYYVRVTRRNPPAARPLGPPEPGDYIWHQTEPITVTAGTTNLGTKYAWVFGSAPITISGTVKNWHGTPLAGRYVKATIEPCIQADGYSGTLSNHCGPEKHLALQRTDANGNYTLYLESPGTFYFYESPCLGDKHQEYSGNPCAGYGTGPVTVKMGENRIVDIIGN
jgi:hypothetical protein